MNPDNALVPVDASDTEILSLLADAPAPSPADAPATTGQPPDELQKYHEAFEQEYTKSSRRSAKVAEEIQDIFVANGVDIAVRLVGLAVSARSDQTKYQISKYIIDKVQDADIDPNQDPFRKLLEQLAPEE
jgi:hypothetical protein